MQLLIYIFKKYWFILLACLIFFIGCSSGGATTTSNPAAKDITEFSINGTQGNINGTEITVTMPTGTQLNNLIASFKTTGSYVTVNNIKQISGQTANDFTNPLIYSVYATNGTTKDYTITVTSTRKSGFFMVGLTSIINRLSLGTQAEYSNQQLPSLPS